MGLGLGLSLLGSTVSQTLL